MLVRKQQLISDRLVLKSIEEKDKKGFMKIVKNEQVKKTYMLPDFSSEEEEEKFFKRLHDFSLDNNRFVYGIYSKNKIIGFLNEVSKNNSEIEIGYFIAPNEWNNGFATEALKTAIEELFRIGFDSVIAAHFENNLASGRVMQKCSMTKIEREETITYRNNSYRCVYYQIKK